MVKIVDGASLAREREIKLKQKVKELNQIGVKVKLAVLVLAGDKAGLLYSSLKQKAALKIGIEFDRVVVSEIAELERLIDQYNHDEEVSGIVVQYPGLSRLKKYQVKWEELAAKIDSKKDVDGLRNDSGFEMGAVKAVVGLINKLDYQKDKVFLLVVGSRGFVGKRLVKSLRNQNFKVKGVDKGDSLIRESLKADILISATGIEGLIKPEMVKKGVVVIDVGWPKGDVEFEGVSRKAGLITPVPGGIGPLTVICLLENLVDSLYTSKITHTHQPS